MPTRLSRCVLFIIFIFSTTGAAHAVDFGLSVGGDFISSAYSGLPGKAQGGIHVTASFGFPFTDWIGAGTALVWGNEWPSDLSGGFGYRGYWEGGLSLYLYLQTVVLDLGGAGLFRAGGRTGMTASLATYQYSTLTFFAPRVDLSPYVSFSPRGLRGWDFILAAPAHLILRRDMAYSWSMGLELGASYTVGMGK